MGGAGKSVGDKKRPLPPEKQIGKVVRKADKKKRIKCLIASQDKGKEVDKKADMT